MTPKPPALRAESVGQPATLSSLARLLVRLHRQREQKVQALRLVERPKETTTQ